MRGHTIDEIDEPQGNGLVGPGPAQVGQRHASTRMFAQCFEFDRSAIAPGTSVDENAGVKQHRQLQAGSEGQGRLHAVIVREPAAGDHLHAGQPRVDGALQVVGGAGVQRVDHRKTSQAVAMPVHQSRQMVVGPAQ